MSLNIHSATSNSAIQTIAELAETIWTEHYIPIIGIAQVEYMLNKFQSPEAITTQIEKEGYEYFLLLTGGKEIGYISVIKKEKELFLSKIYLLSTMRGEGFGREGIAFLIGKCITEGLTCITLTVNKHNTNTIKAYEKLGFTIYGEVVSDIGSGYVMDDYLMRLVLDK